MPNLKAATKKSIYEANVSKLDAMGQPFGDFVADKSLTIIEGVLGDFVERVHDNINKEKGMVTTGRINDITIQAEDGGVTVRANKWLLYQDRGVNGSGNHLYDTPHAYTDKMPPVNVFKQWIKDKNIRLVDNHKYKGDNSPFQHLTEEQKIDKAAWGMAKNVFKNGFKPRNIYSKEIPQLVKDLEEQVAGFCLQAISQAMDVKPSAQRTIVKE